MMALSIKIGLVDKNPHVKNGVCLKKSDFQSLVLLDFATLGHHTGHGGATSVTRTSHKVLSVCQVRRRGPLGVTLGSAVVTRVLHEVRVGWEGCPGVDYVGAGGNGGVNPGDEGLGQPRQVVTATV